MEKRLVFAALLAPLVVGVPLSHADAQSRGSVGGYSSGATVGGGSYGGGLGSPPAITRTAPVTRAVPAIPSAPALRSGPAAPPYNPMTSPGYGTSGYYRNNIGRVPPGTPAIRTRPGYVTGR